VLIVTLKAVILAGGRGTRLSSMTKDIIPKVLVQVAGKPVIIRQMELLTKHGVKEIIVTTGYLSEVLFNYLGNDFHGAKIVYAKEEQPLGTAGGLSALKGQLDDDFFLLYGDVVCDMNLTRLMEYHRNRKGSGTLVVHPNDHPFDSDLIATDHQGRICKFLPETERGDGWYRNLVNAAVYVFSPKIFNYILDNVKQDFVKDVFPRVIADGQLLWAYETTEYLKDMGTYERLARVEIDYNYRIPELLRLSNYRPAVFIDRDGVLNREVDNLCCAEDLELIPGVALAIRHLNKAGYLVIIVTNQPMIAKGFLNEEELARIHAKLETLLGYQGAFIDKIYYCPHHPEKGHYGEVTHLKIDCECRKPKAGMFFKAFKEFSIDKSKSLMIGDSWRDAAAAQAAGLRFYGVRSGWGCRNMPQELKPLEIFEDLASAVDHLIESCSSRRL